MSVLDDFARYEAACHAMQTGVKLDMENGSNSASPKYLRVGVNSAMVEHSALVQLLVRKGLITDDEYFETLADGMEEEVKRYEDRLKVLYGVDVKLG